MRVAAIGFLTLGLAACRAPNTDNGAGRLEARWDGTRKGSIAGPATAGWCAIRQVLQIRTVQGDTGFAVALYPGKVLVPGVYPVVDPLKAESIPPAASLALRMLSENLVQGFQGDSGRVSLERSISGRFSGTVRGRARSVVDTQRISLDGKFTDLTVLPDTTGCSPPESPEEDF